MTRCELADLLDTIPRSDLWRLCVARPDVAQAVLDVALEMADDNPAVAENLEAIRRINWCHAEGIRIDLHEPWRN